MGNHIPTVGNILDFNYDGGCGKMTDPSKMTDEELQQERGRVEEDEKVYQRKYEIMKKRIKILMTALKPFTLDSGAAEPRDFRNATDAYRAESTIVEPTLKELGA